MQIGAEYYLAGRFAFLQRCRISANLFHHSAEMFLKYDLVRDVASNAQPKYRHDLKRMWSAFKGREASRSALSKWDSVVEGLDDWEHLRYPSFRVAPSGKAVSHAMVFHPQQGAMRPSHSDRELDEYVLCLEDIDELLAAIITAASINPAVLFMTLASESLDWYQRENRHPLTGVATSSVDQTP
jgi:hypothetical protein